MQPVQQAPEAHQAPQEPIRRRISNFLAATVSRFRIVLLVILIAAAAFWSGTSSTTRSTRSSAQTPPCSPRAPRTCSDTWQAETDVAKKGALEKELLDQLGTLINRYPRQYGGQRGLFIRAESLLRQEGTGTAREKDYQTLAARFPTSYLAPISLFNAAVCLEEKGDAAAALKLYVRVFEKYKDSPVAPRALFDAARLDEQKGVFDDARKKYEQIDTQYPSSTWDKLAKNRIVGLKVEGKIK